MIASSPLVRRTFVLSSVGAVALFAVAALRAPRTPPPVPLDRVHPGVPWTRLVPQLAPVEGVAGVRAADCGKCHERHYQEWKQSTHAHAYTDLQFQSEIAKPNQPAWLCLNCHIPVTNQRDEVVRSLIEGDLRRPVREVNPGFDPVMRDEGVTCAVCHVRKDERGRSYILGSVEGPKPPHPVRVDRAALLARCNDCHDQTYRLTDALVCHFQSGSELRQGPEGETKQCADCHLPAVERPLVKDPGAPIRTAHVHGFVGGGVPKERDLLAAQEALGYRPGLEVRFEVGTVEAETVRVLAWLSNDRAGHFVPTGDPERHVLVEAELLDAGGQVLGRNALRIGQQWVWEPVARQVFDNRVAPGETRVVVMDVKAGEERRQAFTPRPEWNVRSAPVPPGTGRPTRLRVTATHVRLSDDNAAWMRKNAAAADPRFAPGIARLLELYPSRRVFFSEERALVVP